MIYASSISDQSGSAANASNPWNGVIFVGNSGKVYGASVTPATNFEVKSGQKLLIPEGTTLNIASLSVANNGGVYMGGTLNGAMSGSGSYYYPLTVNGGTAGGDSDTYMGLLFGKAGGTVTLTGKDAPVGMAVDSWVTSDEDVTVVNHTFVMPSGSLTVSANSYVISPTYTVTIPATVALGETATVSASGVNVISGSNLVVTLTDAQGFKLENDDGVELSYTIMHAQNESGEIEISGGSNSPVNVSSAVLTIAGGTANDSASATLNFVPAAVTYSGEYKGAVTFTVAVQEGSGS